MINKALLEQVVQEETSRCESYAGVMTRTGINSVLETALMEESNQDRATMEAVLSTDLIPRVLTVLDNVPEEHRLPCLKSILVEMFYRGYVAAEAMYMTPVDDALPSAHN